MHCPRAAPDGPVSMHYVALFFDDENYMFFCVQLHPTVHAPPPSTHTNKSPNETHASQQCASTAHITPHPAQLNHGPTVSFLCCAPCMAAPEAAGQARGQKPALQLLTRYVCLPSRPGDDCSPPHVDIHLAGTHPIPPPADALIYMCPAHRTRLARTRDCPWHWPALVLTDCRHAPHARPPCV